MCAWCLCVPAVGATAGGVLSSVGDAAKGLLGALLGPFERERAFDESTAALTGKRLHTMHVVRNAVAYGVLPGAAHCAAHVNHMPPTLSMVSLTSM
jgi:hypothetical protein